LSYDAVSNALTVQASDASEVGSYPLRLKASALLTPTIDIDFLLLVIAAPSIPPIIPDPSDPGSSISLFQPPEFVSDLKDQTVEELMDMRYILPRYYDPDRLSKVSLTVTLDDDSPIPGFITNQARLFIFQPQVGDAGVYEIKLKLQDIFDTSIFSFTLTVLPLPNPNITIEPEPEKNLTEKYNDFLKNTESPHIKVDHEGKVTLDLPDKINIVKDIFNHVKDALEVTATQYNGTEFQAKSFVVIDVIDDAIELLVDLEEEQASQFKPDFLRVSIDPNNKIMKQN